MKRVVPLFFISLFLFGALSVPKMATGMHVSVEISPAEVFNEQQLISALPAQFVDRPIRVAIYDEDNLTAPAISDAADLTNNLAEITALLEGAGHSVALLTEEDILNHELLTADYDVFIIVNNIPRPSISKLVKEFWLGGGGLMTFHGAVSYLWYEGFIIAGLDYDVGNEDWWGYFSSDSQNVTSRHATMKEYHVNDTVYERAELWATSWEPKLIDGRGDDMIFLMNNATRTDYISAFAIENSRNGGRIVQLPGDGSSIPTDFESIIVDSVEWLNPRPKGRVLFDYSHFPYYGIDAGDPTGYNIAGRYSIWRDYLVNHSFTVDKLYYSAEGNLTAENLALYDMLVIAAPEWNFTAAEVAAVTSWVEAGGGLFVMGEFNPGFTPENQNLNYLLTNFDLSLNTSDDYVGALVTTDSFMHLINEGVAEVEFSGGSFVNHSGSAYPIWLDGGNTLLAGQEYGNGRVLVSGDINCLGNYIESSDNLHLSLSMANWLTSGGAPVLIYADTWGSYGGTANNNPYKGPVAAALRDLGIRFQLTYELDYFNLSLHANEWDLVVFDNLNLGSGSYFDDIYDYAQGNGRLIMSTWLYYGSTYEYLWNHLGFTKANNTYDETIPFYLWEDQHPIFTNPVLIDTWNMSSPTLHPGTTDAANLTALDNGTVLAGYSTIPSKTNASIILGPNGQFLTNSMLLTEYVNDTDDSTYPDCYELWMNEIAFMLRPFMDHPSNMQFEGGSTGNTITWHPTSWSPAEYTVVVDGEVAQTGAWSGESIVFNVNDLLPGTHGVSLEVSDSLGCESDDEVTVLVEDTTLPIVGSPDDVTVDAGGAANVTWTAYDLFPDHYRLLVNGTEELVEDWDGAAIDVSVMNLEMGVYNFTIEVVDTSGNRASDTVIVLVADITLPIVGSPDDVTVDAGGAANVTWTAYDLFPDHYRLLVNGTEELVEDWDGAAIDVSVMNLEIGVYNFTIEVVDASGNRASDTVIVTVTAGITGFDPATLLLIGGVGVVVVVVVLLILKKRGAGASK